MYLILIISWRNWIKLTNNIFIKDDEISSLYIGKGIYLKKMSLKVKMKVFNPIFFQAMQNTFVLNNENKRA